MPERLQISFQNDKLPNPFILKGFGFFHYFSFILGKTKMFSEKAFNSLF